MTAIGFLIEWPVISKTEMEVLLSILTESSENRYTSVIRSRLRAASEEDQYDNTEEVSDRTTGEVHIHHYNEGEITRESDCPPEDGAGRLPD